jgi:hypothetical protein
MTTVNNTINVVLALKPASVPKLIVRATSIVNAMTANKTTFPAPTPTLAQCLADITALTNAETALKSHTGPRADRDNQRKLVVADMQSLHAYVQQLASASPAQASAIATDADMTLRKVTAHTKAPLAVKQTVSGSVKVVAKATKGAKGNEWQYSVDGGKTWIDVPPTTKATVTINSLTPGVTVSYRQRVLTKTGLGDWSQPISALVT